MYLGGGVTHGRADALTQTQDFTKSYADLPYHKTEILSLYCFLSVQYLNYISVFQLIALN
jgi:hypothetical protein